MGVQVVVIIDIHPIPKVEPGIFLILYPVVVDRPVTLGLVPLYIQLEHIIVVPLVVVYEVYGHL